MNTKIRIAVDAMGGENSPNKILKGIQLALKNDSNNFFLLYGNKEILKKNIQNFPSIKKSCEIIHTEDQILDDESPLKAIKRGKKSSMWSSIESQTENFSDITLSAGNTGALLIISRMILKTLEGIDKPALAGLWPNKNGMNIVLDLGANIECNEKNLIDFSNMGSALYKSIFKNDKPRVALLNIGL